MSGPALTTGVEIHDIEGVTVRVTSPAKTIADTFEFRNRVGLDAARVCRVERVMRPYLEAIL